MFQGAKVKICKTSNLHYKYETVVVSSTSKSEMISSKLLAMLLPLMIAAQSTENNIPKAVTQKSPILPNQGSGDIADQPENKLLGQNKHSNSPMGGSGPSYGGYGYGGYGASFFKR